MCVRVVSLVAVLILTFFFYHLFYIYTYMKREIYIHKYIHAY